MSILLINGVLFISALVLVYVICQLHRMTHQNASVVLVWASLSVLVFFYKFIPDFLSGIWKLVSMSALNYFLFAALVFMFVYAYILAGATYSRGHATKYEKFQAVCIGIICGIVWFPIFFVLSLWVAAEEFRWHIFIREGVGY